MPIPRDQLPIGEGLYPDGAPEATFFIDRAELDILENDGPEWKLHDARFIKEAIKDPDAIFQGLRRPGHDESFAYAVRPTHDPEDDQASPVPPRFGFVFVVYVRTGVGGYVVFDWEWRPEDADAPGYPMNWKYDFEKQTWRKT